MTDNPMQALLDKMSAMLLKERQQKQLTLGALIDYLETVPSKSRLTWKDGKGIARPHSYRGYYSDLALSYPYGENSGLVRVGTVLTMLKEKCLGQTFEGYKGGDYRMDRGTPLWCSPYGVCSNLAIVSVERDEKGHYYLRTQKVEDHY
jgi:hypothetical protein